MIKLEYYKKPENPDDGPTQATKDRVLSIKKQMVFNEVIDNLEEDTLSDDELIVEIKTRKVAEMNRRADLVCEETAIKQVINES